MKKRFFVLVLSIFALTLSACGAGSGVFFTRLEDNYGKTDQPNASQGQSEDGQINGNAHTHDFSDASCTVASTCKTCGFTEGEALGHDFSEATCTEAAICKRCGLMDGEALGHVCGAANCTEHAVCERCGAIVEQALGHEYQAADCTNAAVCTRCGETGQEALGHDYSGADCTKGGVCTRCGAKGEALGHSYSKATCTKGSVCERCGAEKSGALGHEYYKGPCKRCGDTNGPLTAEEGKWFTRSNKLTDEQNAEALVVARKIADHVMTYLPDGRDIDRVILATLIVGDYVDCCEYTMQGPNYNQAYGVFIAGEYSCAGSTRAIGLVLTCMGYEWTHVNENQNKHQWASLMMDGQIGYTDGYFLVGYGDPTSIVEGSSSDDDDEWFEMTWEELWGDTP